MSASVWEGSTTIGSTANADNTYLTEEFTVSIGAVAPFVFALTSFAYAPNTGSIDVYVNGVKQSSSVFDETDTTTITISDGLEVGDLVIIKGLVGSTDSVSAANSALMAAQSALDSATSATNSATSATNALASQILAASIAAGISSTSTTEHTISTGVKIFVTQSAKQYQPGMYVLAVDAADVNNWVFGQITSYVGTSLTINVIAIRGTGTKSSWIIALSGIQGIQGLPGTTQITYEARSSNTALTQADAAKSLELTGTFTQTFTTIDMVPGWWVEIQNVGTGEITIPASDGKTNWKMYPEELRRFMWDGTTFRTKLLKGFNLTVTALTNFIPPPLYTEFFGYIHAAGNGGAFRNDGGDAYGGGGGGRFPFNLPATLFGTSTVITVGQGGIAKNTPDTTQQGNLGGNTSIGSLLSIGPDVASQGSSIENATVTDVAAVGFERTTRQGTEQLISMYGGLPSITNSANTGSPAYKAVYGSGNGGSVLSSTLRSAGTSRFAGNGGAASIAAGVPAGDGSIPGGGGGANQNGTRSGAGGRGEVNIRGRQ